MNKKQQLEQLRASMQAIDAGVTLPLSVQDEGDSYNRKRRRSAIREEIKVELADTDSTSKKKTKSQLSFTTQELPPEELARQYALDCLSRREYGTQELHNKMLGKAHEPAVIAQVLRELTDEDLLSDERFAEAMLSHGAFKGQGPRKIRHDLAKKSLPAHFINAAFEVCEIDWFALAKEVRTKKYGTECPKEWKDKAKQMRFMQTRGFEIEHINGSFGE
ncbi:MAG: regulatory protein RecX [Gammaproteobacteria bacterium]|nr:recombination regulator RecX [Gammaproteobacteria bacterium]NNC96612.1 regulatory protein RecX [Gammaproteobacteria bacterium]NNM12809.1 regulatory protein RecX [Gammaproteobacteria bacterium]